MNEPLPAGTPPNVVTPTLGGKQFWGDEQFFHQWRIQRNTFTGHCRLLDGDCRRHAWGSFEHCQAKLDEIKRDRGLEPMKGAAVIALHGLIRTPAALDKMCRFLRDQGRYSVFNVTYPTTRRGIDEHAEQLAKIIERLDGIDEINFVAHSLGNLVIRRYMAAATDKAAGKQPDARIKRIVMLAPPNNGALMADALFKSGLAQWLIGKSGTQIAQWDELQGKLATPACEFGIIAGGRGDQKGYNPWLGEDNDLVVEVATTRLAGAADFVVVPAIHTFLMDDPTVQQYTLRFLQSGCFISAEKRQPIPVDGRQ